MSELLQQTYQGMYVDGNKHAGVDARLCASVIEHSHGFCNHLIEQDDALSGSIDELRTESIVAQPDVEADIEADMQPFPGTSDEEGEDT